MNRLGMPEKLQFGTGKQFKPFTVIHTPICQYGKMATAIKAWLLTPELLSQITSAESK